MSLSMSFPCVRSSVNYSIGLSLERENPCASKRNPMKSACCRPWRQTQPRAQPRALTKLCTACTVNYEEIYKHGYQE